VAGYPLISDYLLAFDSAVPVRPDAADLRDELADHLIEAADRLRASGVGLEEAQRCSIDRFGEPAIIASIISAVPPKGSPMYTFFTRGASYFAFAAAALWVAAAAALPFAVGNLFVTWTQAAYITATLVIAAAIAASALVLLAVHVRRVGSFDAIAGLVALLLVFAGLTAAIVGWFFVVWLGLLLAATLITLLRARNTAIAAGAPTILLCYIWPTLVVLTVIAAMFLSNPSSTIGTAVNDAVQVGALVLLVLVYAAGIVTLGLRLRMATSHDADRGPLITA